MSSACGVHLIISDVVLSDCEMQSALHVPVLTQCLPGLTPLSTDGPVAEWLEGSPSSCEVTGSNLPTTDEAQKAETGLVVVTSVEKLKVSSDFDETYIESCSRLGKPRPGHHRLVKVRFNQ